MPRNRITRPQNRGQNRNVQMRNNARRSNPFQGGLAKQPAGGAGQCPAGQQPTKDPRTGKMTCAPVAAERSTATKPVRNKGGY